MSDLEAARRYSVTEADTIPIKDGSVWIWTVVDGGGGAQQPGLPAHWSMARDVVLAATPLLADFWAVALKTAINQIVVRKFTVKDRDDRERRAERARDLVLDLGGPAMYTEELERIAADYFTCDNGAWVEIARDGRKPTAKPVGLFHLDSHRCYPTGDREHPVQYIDLAGVPHLLPAHNVFRLVDQPSPRLRSWGVGLCAASAAWRSIVLDGAVQTYLTEKISGSRALALHFVKGVSRKQLGDAAETAEAEQQRRGNLIYKGAMVVPVLDDVQVASIDLASIPDGFDPAVIYQRLSLTYSLALGMPYTDIATLQGGQFGTGTQSQVIDESRKGRGVEKFVSLWERKLNALVLPRATTIDLFGVDVRDQKAESEVRNTEATYVKTLVEAQIITPAQAANYLADSGWLPPEFVAQDQTAGATLTDSGEHSKAGEGAEPPTPTPTPTPTPGSALAALVGTTGKAVRPVRPAAMVVDDAVIAAANKLRAEVRGE